MPDASAMGRFAATGLPAYTFLDGFLLTGAPASRLSLLDAAGLEYSLLDADLRGGRYYLAYVPTGRVTPAWESFGRRLLVGCQLRSAAHHG